MSEVIKEAPVVEAPKVEVVVDPIESEAREQGWVSKDEWVESGRSADEWRPAKEFKERGELFKKIHNQGRELKQTQAALTALQKHHLYVFERAQQKALDELKREKRVALRNEDLERVEQLEDEMEELQKTHVEEKKQLHVAQAAQQAAAPNPTFVEWQERNTWYVTDGDLRDFADAIGIMYTNRNPGSDPNTVLKYVETEVRRKYPEKFGRPKAAPSPTVSADPANRVRKSSADDGVELDETEYQIMQTLVKTGVMTEKQYKDELKKVKKG